MSAAHTAGPWNVAKGAPEYICSDGKWIACTMGVRGTPEAEANARLIAAAPDLLAALQAMTRAFAPFPREDTEGWREEHEAFEAARAAIAKATEPTPC